MTDRNPNAAEPERLKALVVLMAGAAIIGAAPILVRLADAGPAAAGFWRQAFALPLLALIVSRQAGGASRPSRAGLWAGAMFALDLAFWHYSLAFTSVANATVLTNLTPVVVTAFAWLVFKEQPRRLFLLAVAIAVAGAWIMAAAKGGTPGKAPLLGDALAIATTLWYALYMIAVAQARRAEGAIRVMFWSTLVSAPLLLIAALAMGERVTPGSAGGWAACLGLALVHVAGQGAIAWSLGRLPAAIASVVVLIQPVVATLLGWVLFSEALGAWQTVGAVLALSGIVLAQWSARPRLQPQAE